MASAPNVRVHDLILNKPLCAEESVFVSKVYDKQDVATSSSRCNLTPPPLFIRKSLLISQQTLSIALSCLGRLLRCKSELQVHLKQLPHVSSFYRKLIRHLTDKAPGVVLHALDILAMLVLEDEVGEKVKTSRYCLFGYITHNLH